jgi:hypothetical protein
MRKRQTIKVSALTKAEFEEIKLRANFSKDQELIYDALNRDDLYDYAIIRELRMSEHHYYYLKSIVLLKVERISAELGYNKYMPIIPHNYGKNDKIT